MGYGRKESLTPPTEKGGSCSTKNEMTRFACRDHLQQQQEEEEELQLENTEQVEISITSQYLGLVINDLDGEVYYVSTGTRKLCVEIAQGKTEKRTVHV